jgi:hypothetical protein
MVFPRNSACCVADDTPIDTPAPHPILDSQRKLSAL